MNKIKCVHTIIIFLLMSNKFDLKFASSHKSMIFKIMTYTLVLGQNLKITCKIDWTFESQKEKKNMSQLQRV